MSVNARSLFLDARRGARLVGGVVLLAAGSAWAGDVYWSVGVQSPGIGGTVSNAPPVVYAPPVPVVVIPAPQVVYAQPQVVYAAPPVVYTPRVTYAPVPSYVVPVHPYKHKKHKRHHHGEWHGWQHHGGHVNHVRHGGWGRH